MAKHPLHPLAQNPNAGSADQTPRPPTSDEKLKAFWLKNEKSIYIACGVIVVCALVFSLIGTMRSSAEGNRGSAFATAAGSPDKMRAFINDNSGHILAAAAAIRLADDAYAKKNYTEAAVSYEKAAADKTVIFAPRARLGVAMSKIMGGQTAEGETRLAQILNDATLPVTIRGEAGYHLGRLAQTTGRAEAAAKLYEQVIAIAPKSPWAEDATYQRDRLPLAGNAALPISVAPGTTAAPAISLPAR